MGKCQMGKLKAIVLSEKSYMQPVWVVNAAANPIRGRVLIYGFNTKGK